MLLPEKRLSFTRSSRLSAFCPRSYLESWAWVMPTGGGSNRKRSRSLVLTSLFLMFNFSANHLLLLSRMEYRTCVVFLMKDDSTRRVYRLYDFTKSQIITSDHYYCVSGKVNSADKLYLVIESVKRDTKHSPDPQLRLEWTAREKRP